MEERRADITDVAAKIPCASHAAAVRSVRGNGGGLLSWQTGSQMECPMQPSVLSSRQNTSARLKKRLFVISWASRSCCGIESVFRYSGIRSSTQSSSARNSLDSGLQIIRLRLPELAYMHNLESCIAFCLSGQFSDPRDRRSWQVRVRL